MSATRLLPALLATAALAAAGLAPVSAGADDRVPGRDRFAATARVIESRPVHVDVTVREPRLECVGDNRRDTRVEVYGARPGDRDRMFPNRYGPSYGSGYGYGHEFGHDRGRGRVGVRAATVAGAALGGFVGDRIARDESDGVRIGATIAGSLIGSGLGRRVATGHRHRPFGLDTGRYGSHGRYGAGGRHAPDRLFGPDRRHGRKRCVRVVETRTERRLDHYDVTYVLRGRTFRTRRAGDPGDTIDIDVSLPPARR